MTDTPWLKLLLMILAIAVIPATVGAAMEKEETDPPSLLKSSLQGEQHVSDNDAGSDCPVIVDTIVHLAPTGAAVTIEFFTYPNSHAVIVHQATRAPPFA